MPTCGEELGGVSVQPSAPGASGLVPRLRGCLSDFISGPAREMRETNGLLREEVEGLQRKLGRQEKMQENLVNLELEKEVRSQSRVLFLRGVLSRGLWMFQSYVLVGHLKCGLLCVAVMGRIVAPKGSHILIPKTVNLLGGGGELRVPVLSWPVVG